MSSLPSLLERLACTPYDDAFAAAIEGLEPALRDALLSRDVARFDSAIGGRRVMACMVVAPDQESPEPAERPQEEESDPLESEETPGL